MFRGILDSKTPALSKHARRLALTQRQSSSALHKRGGAHFAGLSADDDRAPNRRVSRRNTPRARKMHTLDCPSSSSSLGRSSTVRDFRRERQSSSTSYDSVLDSASGSSMVQELFNELVHRALLTYGPPLPPEVVAENDIITSSTRGYTAREAHRMPIGPDGKSFVFNDEVSLKTYELLEIIRREKADWSVHTDGDGLPLSLLIRNCNYLRAFGGKVCYMRYLRREEMLDGTNRIVVALSQYKMREAASQDGIRQGPQPWLHRYSM